jgi:hypothetical protein
MACRLAVRFRCGGLTDMLDEEIAPCLAQPDAEAVPRLFDGAMAAGGATMCRS